MERDANVDKKKQMTLTFQMRKDGAFFDVLSFCLKDSKHGISSLINITSHDTLFYFSFVNEQYACESIF